MRNIPEKLQDDEISAAFRSTFNDAMANKITLDGFRELHHSAVEAAEGSVLAACIADITQAVKEQNNLQEGEVPRRRRSWLRTAETTADKVESLDVLTRDPGASRDELVLYVYDEIKDRPGASTGFHLTAAEGTRIEHHVSEPNKYRSQYEYHFSPHIKAGADSMYIFHGKAGSWLQGNTQHFNARDNDDYKGFFGKYVTLSYRQLMLSAAWGRDIGLPALTIGTDQVVELFDRMIQQDAQEAYTELRTRRPSYTLYRQARFLGAACADTMLQIADDSDILAVWRQQKLDEEAIFAVNALNDLSSQNVLVADMADDTLNPLSMHGFLNMSSMDIDWLGLSMSDFEASAKRHAKRLGYDLSGSEIAAGLHISLEVELRDKLRR